MKNLFILLYKRIKFVFILEHLTKHSAMNKFLLSAFFFLCGLYCMAQHTVTGIIIDEDDLPLIGVNVLEKGSYNGTVTDIDGKFSLEVSSENAILFLSYVGFANQDVRLEGQSDVSIVLLEGLSLGEVQVVGSRNANRSATNSPVAIDIINIADIPTRNGQVEINQILQYAAPSFNASKQSGSDGADHIDPASLRGLGPDQTLVLINGKRRHQSSLVNVFGSRGRGNTGTDLNNIPASSIKRIEVLRDGASAQYGSDAIAGVINIVLKDNVGEVSGAITYGANSTNAAAPDGGWEAGTANAGGENRLYDEDRSFDGNTIKVEANYGMPLGKDGGFANVTTELLSKDRTLRPGASFRMGYGDAAVNGFNVMINSAIPLDDKTEVYAFGGRNYRDTDAYAFSRGAGDARTVASIYPDGFTPRITSIITDASASMGVRHELNNGWNVDFNNTYGKNNFHYFIKNTNNASLESASPTDFDAGGHSLSQNTTGLDFSKFFDGALSGINVAFGTEYRTENFQIFAGETGSYATYDVNGLPITRPDQMIPVDSISGEERPGGSQGFPGYSPDNEVDRNRSNLGFYVDTEFNISEAFLLGGAVRFENYSDFGETFNYKVAARYKVLENLAIRASASSGFRAPSLAQIYYNLRFTNFVGGDAREVLLSANNSPVTRGFGIGELQQETAFNLSAGLTFSTKGFTATIDGYSIDVTDRIVLTEYFDAEFLDLNVVAAQFFANGVDTKTQGVDVVLNYKKSFGKNKLNVGVAANFNQMEIETIHNGDLDVDTFFGPREQYFLQASAPDYKISANLGYTLDKINFAVGLTQFSEVTILDWQSYEADADYGGREARLAAAEDVYEPGMVLDASVSFNVMDNLILTVGGNNILNAYPTIQDDWTDSGGYWDSVQMGTSGAYFFGRVGFKF